MSLDHIYRREAQRATGGRQHKGTMAVTAYNPQIHAAKGVLLPSMVETGWVPLASHHAGDGYGVMVGPNAGSATDLDGDWMDVEFENGDPNTPIAKHKHFTQADNPPVVQSGEILVKHQTGGSTLHKADGSIVTTHKDGGQHMFDADGNHSLVTKDKNVTIDAGQGSQTFTAKSHSFTADNISLKGAVTVNGQIIQQNGGLSSTGTIAGQTVMSAGKTVQTA
ncbi:phage baseplate assembly protein V [Methylobacterium sp. E-005]|uniref:phage baseplate assembly protein V n=1 Tax=Methylobacterium sp. E-005 TaxID=2836549 RepID=UPI001FBA9604|nr:phage baseplate assembly protein V [Methylobacterium sp. E-005]MCJ2084593.1 phage baseplate assembly protein V [Methylobacterium sp. E-005]